MINKKYRKIDKSTDVLSFPMEEVDPRGVNIIGDIVICMEQAECQAEEFGHSVVREVAYLSVHSVLHLLGYDHEREEDKLEKAKEHKHMTFTEAACMARDADVKKMWLTHYSPSLVNPKEFMRNARKIFPESYPGKDGLTEELNYEE